MSIERLSLPLRGITTIVIVTLVLTALGIWVMGYRSHWSVTAAPASEAAAYESFEVQRMDLVRSVTVRGVVGYASRYNLLARFSGKLVDHQLVVGEQVQQGQVIVRFDAEPLQRRVLVAQKRLTAAEHQLEQAQKSIPKTRIADLRLARDAAAEEWRMRREAVERLQRMIDHGLAARHELEQARRQLGMAKDRHTLAEQRLGETERQSTAGPVAQAEAAIIEARQMLELAESHLEHAELKAPVSGKVIAISPLLPTEHAQTNVQEIPQGTVLCTIAEMGSRQVTMEVFGRDVDQMQLGDPVRLRRSAEGPVVGHGVVDQIGTTGQRFGSGYRYPVQVSVRRGAEELRVGRYLWCQVEVAKAEQVLVVPSSCVLYESGRSWCLVRLSDGRVVRQSVELGLDNGEQVAVKSGLQAGQVVVRALRRRGGVR